MGDESELTEAERAVLTAERMRRITALEERCDAQDRAISALAGEVVALKRIVRPEVERLEQMHDEREGDRVR